MRIYPVTVKQLTANSFVPKATLLFCLNVWNVDMTLVFVKCCLAESFFFLVVVELELRASRLLGFARQALYHLSHSTSPWLNLKCIQGWSFSTKYIYMCTHMYTHTHTHPPNQTFAQRLLYSVYNWEKYQSCKSTVMTLPHCYVVYCSHTHSTFIFCQSKDRNIQFCKCCYFL
jgi:hypothetical protein